jgi:glycosyltransferase involved in cell wall biosynthesis
MRTNKTNKVKIRVHIAPSLDYGGLETQLTNLGIEYNRIGRTDFVEFWSLRSGGLAESKLKELGFVVRILNHDFRTMNPILMFKLGKTFRTVGVNEVFTHGFESNLNGIIAARLAGIKSVIAEEIGISKHKHLLHIAFKINYFLIRYLTVQSQQMKASIEKSNEVRLNKIAVVYPPVQLDRVSKNFSPSTKKSLKFVFIGRIEKVKNLNLMIESLHAVKVKNKIENWTLEVYGSGSEEKSLQDLIFRLGLQNHITFKGVTNKVSEAVSIADWMLLSSDSEGFGLVIVESMLCGTPVISTNVGIAGEIITSNKNGYLTLDHSVDSFVIGLLNAFELTAKEYREISKAAFHSAKDRFNPAAYVKELDKLMEGSN